MKIHLQRHAGQRPGFTLVMTLTILAAVTILVVGLFSMSSGEKQISASFDAVEQADLAVNAGLAKASSLLDEATSGDDSIIFSKPLDPPTDSQGRVREQLMAARYDEASSKWLYIPLLSGVTRPAGTAKLVMDVDSNGQVDAPQPLVPPTAEEQQALTNLPKTLPWKARPVCFWENLTVPKPVAGTGDEVVSRFCFAVEDLQGLTSLNDAGNTDGTGDAHDRTPFSLTATPPTAPVPGLNITDTGKPLLNQTALYTVMYPTAADDSTLMKMDNRLVKARYALFTPDNWKDALSLADAASGWTAATPDTFKRDTATGRLVDTAARALEENTVAGLMPYSELALIPWFPNASTFAPAFAGRGEPKLNLNEWLVEIEKLSGAARTLKAKEAVDAIATHIRTHLPQFAAGRRGGYPLGTDKDLAYLKCLAAGMLDYADTDSLPTMEDGQYRGMDSMPLVNEQWQQFRIERDAMENGSWIIYFNYVTHLELWNMTNKSVEGEIKVSFECNEGLVAGGRGSIDLEDDLDEVINPSEKPVLDPDDGLLWLPAKAISLRPNEYKLISIPLNFRLDAGLGAKGDNVECVEDRTSRYYVKFSPSGAADFRLCDMPGGVVERNKRTIRYAGTSGTAVRQAYNTSSPGMSYGLSTNGNDFRNNVSDPRSAFFINAMQSLVNYERGSSPAGRNLRRDGSNNLMHDKIYGQQLINQWADGGHSSKWPAYATNPYTTTKVPDKPTDWEPFKSVTPNQHAPTESTKAPQRISNAGKFFSVTELGHIYDPHMWDPDGGSETSSVSWQHFKDLPAGSSATASPSYCGGNTLRIGRPEHPRFRPDYRTTPDTGRPPDRRYCATALLDLFHTGIPTSSDEEKVTGPLVPVSGHVNLNTATKDTLRAVLAGAARMDPDVAIVSTPTPSPGNFGTQTPINVHPLRSGPTSAQADKLAQAIIDKRPYISAAELAEKVQGTGSAYDDKPIFGDPTRLVDAIGNSFPNTASSSLEINDSALEEFFARAFNSGTVRSRNFRIVVTGQAVRQTVSRQTAASSVRILATRSRVYHVFINPIRDADGNITSQKVEITYARSL